VNNPTRVWAAFVTTFAYGLRPASESALAILSARSCAGVFAGAGGTGCLMIKHACEPSSSAQAVRNLRGSLRGIPGRYDGEGFSDSPSMLTAMPME
jgi:hypothetical protein